MYVGHLISAHGGLRGGGSLPPRPQKLTDTRPSPVDQAAAEDMGGEEPERRAQGVQGEVVDVRDTSAGDELEGLDQGAKGESRQRRVPARPAPEGGR